jgi:hypothetical protein
MSAKSFIRHYNKYVLGVTSFKSEVSRRILNGYCKYLGYEGYQDFIHKNQQNEGDKESREVQKLKKIDYAKEDTHHEWMVYEAAFLWYDLTPPGIEAHFNLMDRDVEKKKDELHNAINRGLLEVKLEYHILGQGFTRYVTREALLKYTQLLSEKPRFLYKEERP